MRLYEQAIRSAAERGFLQDRALAGELAARFYRLRSLDKVADTYLDEARDCYARWTPRQRSHSSTKATPGSDHRHLWS